MIRGVGSKGVGYGRTREGTKDCLKQRLFIFWCLLVLGYSGWRTSYDSVVVLIHVNTHAPVKVCVRIPHAAYFGGVTGGGFKRVLEGMFLLLSPPVGGRSLRVHSPRESHACVPKVMDALYVDRAEAVRTFVVGCSRFCFLRNCSFLFLLFVLVVVLR